VAQQVVMGKQVAPADIGRLLPSSASRGTQQFFAGAAQLALLGLPWNLDCWDGYPAARDRFLAACAANANNALVLGGDSHNCWFNNLTASDSNRLAALEFAGGSVTSPGFEHSLTNAQPGEREHLLRGANPILAWCDLTYRGYGAVKLTRTSCEAEWLAFTDVRSPQMLAPQVTRLSSAPSGSAGPRAWAVAT
jgi:alkaline phosphatase D